MNLGVVILAAGQGTRMRSHLPKVLHPLAGRPLLRHVVDTALALEDARVAIVYGHGGEQVRAAFPEPELLWVHQEEQLGTGHAVAVALPMLEDVSRVLVLYGDVPLIRPSSLKALLGTTAHGLGLMTIHLSDPTGYGRILRDEEDRVRHIVEERDADPGQKMVREVNTGIMVAERALLEDALGKLSNENSQGEFYLTDVVSMAVESGAEVHTTQALDLTEVTGINDRVQLATLERAYQARETDALMRSGVTLADPRRFDLRGHLHAGQDVFLDINVIVEGRVTIADGVSVGANSVLRDCEIGEGVQIRENCVIEDAVIGRDARIGPFARIRPGTRLEEGVHVGNFVELKNARVAPASKINHLSYVGDSDVGAGVNVGAGTITCNYDGANKHRTVIGDNAFIGSNTALVAPLTVGAGATIGAGSVITRDAPEGELTLSRAEQATLSGWKRPEKKSDE